MKALTALLLFTFSTAVFAEVGGWNAALDRRLSPQALRSQVEVLLAAKKISSLSSLANVSNVRTTLACFCKEIDFNHESCRNRATELSNYLQEVQTQVVGMFGEMNGAADSCDRFIESYKNRTENGFDEMRLSMGGFGLESESIVDGVKMSELSVAVMARKRLTYHTVPGRRLQHNLPPLISDHFEIADLAPLSDAERTIVFSRIRNSQQRFCELNITPFLTRTRAAATNRLWHGYEDRDIDQFNADFPDKAAFCRELVNRQPVGVQSNDPINSGQGMSAPFAQPRNRNLIKDFLDYAAEHRVLEIAAGASPGDYMPEELEEFNRAGRVLPNSGQYARITSSNPALLWMSTKPVHISDYILPLANAERYASLRRQESVEYARRHGLDPLNEARVATATYQQLEDHKRNLMKYVDESVVRKSIPFMVTLSAEHLAQFDVLLQSWRQAKQIEHGATIAAMIGSIGSCFLIPASRVFSLARAGVAARTLSLRNLCMIAVGVTGDVALGSAYINDYNRSLAMMLSTIDRVYQNQDWENVAERQASIYMAAAFFPLSFWTPGPVLMRRALQAAP